MTTRQKTIIFVTNSDPTNLAVTTDRDQVITAYIPEFSGTVTFRSVTLQCIVRTNATTAASLTAPTIGLDIDGAGFDTANLGNPVANSGEAQAFEFVRDMTSYFVTNWTTGTSKTVTCRCNFTSIATANHAFRLIITYDYDDTQSTHIKTIYIPIETTRSTLTTSMQTIGGATAIPDFKNTYLPEASPVVRQVWVELWGNEVSSSATYTLVADYDSGTDHSMWLSTNTTINSSVWAHAIWDITAESLTTAAALRAFSSAITGKFDNIGGMVCCTYEFDPASTTTVHNSLILGAFDTSGWIGGTTSGDADAWGRIIKINEPATITLRESAICLSFIDSGGFTLNVSAGAQSPVAYAATAGGIQCGQYSMVHRIDAGGTAGSAGITLARGANSYLAKAYSGTANAGWNLAGFLILNYTSGKSSEGVGAHNQTRVKHVLNTTGTTTNTQTANSISIPIPESDYWLTGCCANMLLHSLNSANGAQSWNVERQNGEGEGSGWETIYVGQYRSDNESSNWNIWGASRKSWRRYPTDPDTDRMDIEASRSHRIDMNPAGNVGALIWYTYHTMTWDVSGDITDSNGGTVNIAMHDYTSGDLLKTTSRVGNGSYSMTWYDDTATVYVTAYEDGTHLGRSGNGNPS